MRLQPVRLLYDGCRVGSTVLTRVYLPRTADENRFMPPQPRAHYGSTFDASNWGPGCIETGSNPDVPKVQSEDCLNVNVWAPTTFSSSSNLPVMVFIFGGYGTHLLARVQPSTITSSPNVCGWLLHRTERLWRAATGVHSTCTTLRTPWPAKTS